MSNLRAVLGLVPAGLNPEEGTVLCDDYTVLAEAVDALQAQADALIAELHPEGTSTLLERWEESWGMAPPGSADEDTRRARLLATIRAIPDFTPTTLETLVEDWTGLAITLVEMGPFLTDDPYSLTDDPDCVVDGAHTFVLQVAWADADAAELNRIGLLAWLQDYQPAHVAARVRCDDFHTDDPLSLTNLDTLGA